MSISSSSGPRRIVYGADCSPTDALTEFAADADLIMVEATLPRPERSGPRRSVSVIENRQVRSSPSAVSRIRLQSPQNGSVTGEMKPISPRPSAKRQRREVPWRSRPTGSSAYSRPTPGRA